MAAIATGLALAAGACDGQDVCTSASPLLVDAGDAASGTDATTLPETGPIEATATTPEDASPSQAALLRVANWSPDAPAVDFCLAPHGTTAFQGPILAGLAAADTDAGIPDAGAPALPFPEVSRYVSVPPGQYDARLVVAEASDCSAPIASDATGLPEFTANAYFTVALIGELNPTAQAPGLELAGFIDSVAAGSAVEMRFINAAPGVPEANFGTGSVGPSVSASGTTMTETFLPFVTHVLFGEPGTTNGEVPDSDPAPSLTYFSTKAMTGGTLSASVPDARSDLAVASDVDLAAGAVATMVLIGSSANAAQTQLLQCIDNAGLAGLRSNCQVVSN
jgi:hypothetical protein